MLKKLFRYDFCFIFRRWWIAAIISAAFAVAGGIAGNVLIRVVRGMTETEPTPIMILQMLGFYFLFLLFLIGVAGLSVFACWYSSIRFYRQLYTDEGALTLMLPVSRRTLLNEKILVGLSVTLLSLLFADACVAFSFWIASFGNGSALWNFWEQLRRAAEGTLPSVPRGLIRSGRALILVLAVVAFFNSVLVPYACLSAGAAVTRKRKFLAGIGFYAGVEALGVICGLIMSVVCSVRMINLGMNVAVAEGEGEAADEVFVQILLNDGVVPFLQDVFRNLWILAGSAAVLAAVSYVLIHRLNRKHLNLT